MFKYFILICLILLNSYSKAEDALTIKQQLDRLQREVSDISELLYTDSGDELNIENNNNINISQLTALDLRIYDLEKDIKKINENLEELVFSIDDIIKMYEDLNLTINSLANNTNKQENLSKNSTSNNNQSLEQENVLGSIVINTEDLSSNDEGDILTSVRKNQSTKMTPKEEFQNAYDALRNQKFEEAKKKFEQFIIDYQENSLSGSAHYWLGEIYILKKEYIEAALVFAEGYQKFPQSSRAPSILYKLSDVLLKINKIEEGCSTLSKLIKEFPKHKITKKAENRIKDINCNLPTE